VSLRGGITWQLAGLVAVLMIGCDSPPPSVVERPGISYIHPKRRSVDEVARASEAFYANESHGQDIVFRTTENERAGYYFYSKLSFSPPVDSRLVLEVVRTEGAAPERYDFSLALRPKFPLGEYVIGLTGKDAGSGNWVPIAWRLTVLNAKGKVLASEHSFLWGTRAELEAR
jgi:hypothetical protein